MAYRLPDEVFGLVKEFLLEKRICHHCKEEVKYERNEPLVSTKEEKKYLKPFAVRNFRGVYFKYAVFCGLGYTAKYKDVEEIREKFGKRDKLINAWLCEKCSCLSTRDKTFGSQYALTKKIMLKHIKEECKLHYSQENPKYKKLVASLTTRRENELDKATVSYDVLVPYMLLHWKQVLEEIKQTDEENMNLKIEMFEKERERKEQFIRNQKRAIVREMVYEIQKKQNKKLKEDYITELARKLTAGEINYTSFLNIMSQITNRGASGFTEEDIEYAERRQNDRCSFIF